MNKILLTEDNNSLTFFIKQYFTNLGYEVECVNSGEKALKLLDKGFDVIMLDIGLPKMNGYSVLNYIRDTDQETPVIMITDKISETHEIDSYNMGATFFHKKPVNFKILAAQVKKVVNLKETKKVAFGNITLAQDDKTLYINDKDIKLTKKEIQFATLLLKNQNKTFSKQELFEEIFEDAKRFSISRIDTFLSRFRSKIGIKFYESSYGLGIKFLRDTDWNTN